MWFAASWLTDANPTYRWGGRVQSIPATPDAHNCAPGNGDECFRGGLPASQKTNVHPVPILLKQACGWISSYRHLIVVCFMSPLNILWVKRSRTRTHRSTKYCVPLQDLSPSKTMFFLIFRPLQTVCIHDGKTHIDIYFTILQWGKGSARPTTQTMQWDTGEIACTSLYRIKYYFVVIYPPTLRLYGIIMLPVLPYSAPEYSRMVIWDSFQPVWPTFFVFCSHVRFGISACLPMFIVCFACS